MKLYLVQHAEAKSKEEDSERPLSDAGVRTVRKVAVFLKTSEAVSVFEIRHSTKVRARQTAQFLAEGAWLQVPIKEVPDLEPLDEVGELADTLQLEVEDLMLVGHLPHLNKLASRLVCGDENAEAFQFQQGGVLCLERGSRGEGEEQTAHWQVKWMVVPELIV